jgi:hypothetical protein
VVAVSLKKKCGRSIPGIMCSNPAGGMDVSCECYVFSGRGLCDGPVAGPEESYCVCVCVTYPETSRVRKPRSTWAVEPRGEKNP